MTYRFNFKLFLVILLTIGFLFVTNSAAEAQSCGFSSQLTASPTNVVDRGTDVFFDVTVQYPISCQQSNGVTAVQIQLRAFDAARDPNGANQRTVTNNTVSFNGSDRVRLQSSLAFFESTAYCSTNRVGLIAVYQASNNAQIFGTTQATYITTSAAPSCSATPTPTTTTSYTPFPSGYGNPGPGSGGFFADPYGPTSLNVLLESIITWVFYLAIPIAIIMLVWAGLMMLTAAGNASKFDKGKKILTYAVIGLTIVFIGRGFISLIQSILYWAQ